MNTFFVDKWSVVLLNIFMRSFSSFILATACMLVPVACRSVEHSYITGVADVPLKTTESVSTSWETSPLRANTRYLLYGANTNKERVARLGDYYYVRWFDAEPDKPMKLVMFYTQARTGSTVLTSEYVVNEPRESKGNHMYRFAFNGDVRRQLGDVLSWRVDLYAGGLLRDSRKSYLWQEPSVTGAQVVPASKVDSVVKAALEEKKQAALSKLPQPDKTESETKQPEENTQAAAPGQQN